MFVLDGKSLALDAPFSHDGINYPANWLRLASPEEREAIGITEEPDPTPYDQRFFWGYDEDGGLIPKDHAALVEQWSSATRTTASTLLAPTDWMVIRKADTGVPIDAATAAWRQSIRDAATTKIAALEATSTTQELAEYITGAGYPEWPVLEAGEPKQPGNWSAFFDALLVSDVFAAARQAAGVDVAANACYTDLAAGLALAKQGNPNVGALQVGLNNMLAALELTDEQRAELATLIEQTGVPLQLPN